MSLLTTCAAVLAGTVMALTSAGGEPAQEIDGAGALIEEYIAENKIGEKQLALGWLDLETGEAYYVNKDVNFYGASLYKVALNMYWAEKVANGEATWDTTVGGGRLETLMTGSLEQSNNNYSYKYWYMENRRHKVVTLLLGDSYIENAINPGLMGKGAFTLASSSRWIYYDDKLLEKYIADMPNLKQVIFGMGYNPPYYRSYHYPKSDINDMMTTQTIG